MNTSGIRDYLRNNAELIAVLCICILAFTLRYHFLITYPFPMMIHEQDAVGYMDSAKKILRLQDLTVSGRPPGYPMVIALFALLPVGLESAARLASIFMDALIVIPLFFLSRIYFSRLPAFSVCLLWAFFSYSLYFSTSPLSQSTYLLYLLSGIVLLYYGLNIQDPTWLFGAGVLFAFSFLARPEGIVGFACGFTVCILPLFRKVNRTRQSYTLTLAFLIGFLLLMGPYLIAFHNETGYWGITAKSEAALKGQDGVVTLNLKGELERTKPGLSVWKEFYGTTPNFISAVANNIKAYYNVYYRSFPPWMHILSYIGILSLLFGTKPINFACLLILLAVTAPNYIVNVSKVHSYIYSVFPLFFICFIAGIVAVFEAFQWLVCRFMPDIKPSYCEASLATILLCIISYISFGFFTIADASYQRMAIEAYKTDKIFKEAGEYIKSNSYKDESIMTRWGLVGYFADRPVITLPKGGVKEVIDYGRKNGARFILIDTESVFSRRQELLELLEPLNNTTINPGYGIEIASRKYHPNVGGYVIYRYIR